MRATDSRDGLVTETSYLQSFPFTGRVDLQTVWNGTHKLSVYDPEWQEHLDAAAAGEPAGGYHFVHLARETREEYETDAEGFYAAQVELPPSQPPSLPDCIGQARRLAPHRSNPSNRLALPL